ncbi:MAG: hypothetical protein ACR2JO_12050 [Mycobacteriales bacterium]
MSSALGVALILLTAAARPQLLAVVAVGVVVALAPPAQRYRWGVPTMVVASLAGFLLS